MKTKKKIKAMALAAEMIYNFLINESEKNFKKGCKIISKATSKKYKKVGQNHYHLSGKKPLKANTWYLSKEGRTLKTFDDKECVFHREILATNDKELNADGVPFLVVVA